MLVAKVIDNGTLVNVIISEDFNTASGDISNAISDLLAKPGEYEITISGPVSDNSKYQIHPEEVERQRSEFYRNNAPERISLGKCMAIVFAFCFGIPTIAYIISNW